MLNKLRKLMKNLVNMEEQVDKVSRKMNIRRIKRKYCKSKTL